MTHLPVQQMSTTSVHERLYDNARQKQAVLAAATLGVPLEEFPASAAAYGEEGEDGDGGEEGEADYGEEEGAGDEEGGAPAEEYPDDAQEAPAGTGSMYLI